MTTTHPVLRTPGTGSTYNRLSCFVGGHLWQATPTVRGLSVLRCSRCDARGVA